MDQSPIRLVHKMLAEISIITFSTVADNLGNNLLLLRRPLYRVSSAESGLAVRKP